MVVYHVFFVEGEFKYKNWVTLTDQKKDISEKMSTIDILELLLTTLVFSTPIITPLQAVRQNYKRS